MSKDGLQTNPKGDEMKALNDVQNEHGPKYDNDTPNNWLRGNGQKPGFDKHKAGR